MPNEHVHNAGTEPGRHMGLPAPLFLSYSSSHEFLALAYDDAIEIYALAAALRPVARVAAAAPKMALWNAAALFVASDSAVTAHFVVPPAPKEKQQTQRTNMAALSGSDGLPPLTGLPTAATYEVRPRFV